MTHESVGIRGQGLIGPHDDDFRLHPFRIVVTVGMQLGIVEDPAVAFLKKVGGHARLIAGVGRKEAKGHVRRTKGSAQHHGTLPHGVAAGAGKGHHALGPDSTVLIANDVAHVGKGIFYEVESFVPSYALPLVGAFFTIKEQRPLEAVMVIDLLDHVEAAEA